MTGSDDLLPAWRAGPARRRLLDLLEHADELPPHRRVAVFDNDGTLWCERPRYPQLDFFAHVLRERVRTDPAVAEEPAFAALLDDDLAALAELGIEDAVARLTGMFAGLAPPDYTGLVRRFFDEATHPWGGSYRSVVYQPMVELLQALRAAGITPMIVSGGGQEFVRAVSLDLYGIPPWHVIGTTVAYDVVDDDGVPVLRRTGRVLGGISEGDAKVANVRLHLGTTPVLAAGNSAGDGRMLDFTTAGDGASLALLVDHDDDEREEAYESRAGSFEAEPILTTAARRGWTVVSVRDDWRTVFRG